MQTINNSRIITALATTTTIKAASEKLGISESNLYKRLQTDAELKREYRSYCSSLEDETFQALIKHNIEAVEVVASIMNDVTAPVATRLNAATYILNNTAKYASITRDARQQFKEDEEKARFDIMGGLI